MAHTPLPINRTYLSHTLQEPAYGDGDDIFYVKTVDGRRAIWRQSLTTGLAGAVTTEPTPAGGVGYGSAFFAVRGDTLIYAAKGGTLQRVDLAAGRESAITPAFEGVAMPVFSPCGRFVAFLAEAGGHCNVLVVDALGQSLPVKLSADPWYAFNPAFSPDGRRIAWQEWDEKAMPWDECRLVIGQLATATPAAASINALVPVTMTIIGAPNVSFGTPLFSPDGQHLAYVSDASGWRSIYVADADGTNPRRLDTGPGELGGPDWVPAVYRYRWSSDGRGIYGVRRHQSRDTLLAIDWASGEAHELPSEATTITSFGSHGDRLIFVGNSPDEPDQVWTMDSPVSPGVARAKALVGTLDRDSLSRPEVISWPTVGGGESWGIFYPAVVGEGQASSGPDSRHPLLVRVHGGPTSEDRFGWNADCQFFATRGWHVLSVNHRGGTGYGRAYQDLLNGMWGVVDMEDARTGAEALIARGLVHADQVTITGGSAGGYTTLMCLARQADFWAAGVSLFGVGNLYDLKLGSHRFEVNYEESIVGPLPEAGPLWVERSPLTHVANVAAPVLLFHGVDDKAVPVQQSKDFAEAVRKRGGIAELVLYEGEGHGFVKEATRRDVLEKSLAFLEKWVVCRQR